MMTEEGQAPGARGLGSPYRRVLDSGRGARPRGMSLMGRWLDGSVTAFIDVPKQKDVIVSTSTASGKSVVYQAPLLRYLEADPSSTAIFVYPRKVSTANCDSSVPSHLLIRLWRKTKGVDWPL